MTEDQFRDFIIEHLRHEVKVREIEMAVAEKDGVTRAYEVEYLEIMRDFIEFAESTEDAQKVYAHMSRVIDDVKARREPSKGKGFTDLSKEERDTKHDVMWLLVAIQGSVTAIDYAVRLIEL